MISQEEVRVKLGLDTGDFERRLRETDAIAKKYHNSGPMNGGAPESWRSVGNLSKQSQEAVKSGRDFMDYARQLGTQISQTHPVIGKLADGIQMFGMRAALVTVPIGAAVGALQIMKSAFREVKEASDLDVSVSFLRELGRASNRAGESVDEAKNRLWKFQQVLASAAEGNKEALEKLGRVGIKDPTGKTLEENLRDVARGLEGITDKAQQAKAAVELFGKGAQASMPDVLANLGGGNKNGVFGSANEDAATLAAGWRGAKGLWSKTGGAFGRYIKEGFEANLAAVLETYFGVEGNVEAPSKLEKTESAEAKAAREKQAQKRAADLVEAQKDYARAKSDSLNTEQKAVEAGLKIQRIQWELRTLGMDEVDRTKKQTELLREQTRFNELNKTLADQRKAIDEKRLNYEQRMADLQKQQAENAKAAKDALHDRSAWTVGDMAGLGGKFGMDSDGLPILPEDMLQSIERALGRSLSNGEIQEMRSRAGGAIGKAGEVSNLQDAAHWMQLIGLGDMADTFTRRGDSLRKGMLGLTTSEQNPMAQFSKNQEKMTEEMTTLVSLAAKDGIVIKPRMGK